MFNSLSGSMSPWVPHGSLCGAKGKNNMSGICRPVNAFHKATGMYLHGHRLDVAWKAVSVMAPHALPPDETVLTQRIEHGTRPKILQAAAGF